MKCHVCGSEMIVEQSDMPFKITQHKVVIFRDLPVASCQGCGEFLLDDQVMAQVEWMLGNTAPEAELDVLRYLPALDLPTHVMQ